MGRGDGAVFELLQNMAQAFSAILFLTGQVMKQAVEGEVLPWGKRGGHGGGVQGQEGLWAKAAGKA